MNIFTQHPHKQGVSYFEHWVFAMGIAWRLVRSCLAFVTHALLPFITIERRFDLEATSAYLLERNRFIEAAAKAGHPGPDADISPLSSVTGNIHHQIDRLQAL